MVRFVSLAPRGADLARILATSAERWGIEGRRRYAAIIAAAMRKAAPDPEGPVTRDRAKLLPGGRSFHLRHARNDERGGEGREACTHSLLSHDPTGIDRNRPCAARA